jgi:DNA-binding CsgD family transcriptional regulator
LLGTIRYQVEDYGRAIELLEQAFAEAGSDAALRASVAMELGFALVNGSRVTDAIPYAQTAVEDAERFGDTGLLAEALGCWVIVRVISGQGVHQAELDRALALEDPERPSHAVRWPSLNAALIALWTHRLDEARVRLAALRQRCLDRGEESDLWFVSYHATDAALSSGDVDAAEQLVDDMEERADIVGTDQARAVRLASRARLQAWSGHIDDARANAGEAITLLMTAGKGSATLLVASTLGMIELSVGDHEATARWLGPAAAAMVSMGLAEPAFAPFLPDAVEALIALDRVDEAEPIVDGLEASGRHADRAWAEAVGARGRGLLLAARGDLDGAVAAFDRALVAHQRLSLRYERGRTLLALGRVQRRRNERRAAQTSLMEAAGLFGDVGTAQWAANAQTELDRLGLRPGPTDQLTPTEARVAELAASGLTNREMAAALSVSPKTIEANLSRLYRKLGIRSRAELGRYMAQQQDK